MRYCPRLPTTQRAEQGRSREADALGAVTQIAGRGSQRRYLRQRHRANECPRVARFHDHGETVFARVRRAADQRFQKRSHR